jgi:hypothetical protein
MELRTLVALSLAIPCVAALHEFSPAVIAQSCNTSPSRPTSVIARRFVDGPVAVEWTVSGACSGERFYLEASRGLSEIIEATADDSDRSLNLPLAANNGIPWRISIRAFNRFGLSSGYSIVLNEGPVIPVENKCPASLPRRHDGLRHWRVSVAGRAAARHGRRAVPACQIVGR